MIGLRPDAGDALRGRGHLTRSAAGTRAGETIGPRLVAWIACPNVV